MTADTGVIYKGIGGFYYVKIPDGTLVECKPRGVFRNRGEKPVAGDRVQLSEEAGTLYISEILPRQNVLRRPPVANVDALFLVASTVEPTPSLLVLDKLSVLCYENEIRPVLVVTKSDLNDPAFLLDAYATSGIPCIVANSESGEGLGEIRGMLAGKLSVFCGNSGVGKSTLLNALLPTGIQRETGEISKKLGRGRHTTREVEILEVPCGTGTGLVADTPGFASLDMQQVAGIPKENLQYLFPEIRARMPGCRFTGCAHMAETGCAVRKAMQAGEIAEGRYASYQTLYTEAKENERY